MADLIKKIKIKKQDGTFTDYIPIGAEAKNVAMQNGDSVEATIAKLDEKTMVYFDTFPTSVQLQSLPNNSFFTTRGFYSKTDGNGTTYLYTNQNTERPCLNINDYNIIPILRPYGEIYLPWLGIRSGDAYAESNTNYYKNLIKNIRYAHTLIFPAGHYYFSEGLTFNQQKIIGIAPLGYTNDINTGGLSFLHFPTLTTGACLTWTGQCNISNVAIWGNSNTYTCSINRNNTYTDPEHILTEVDNGHVIGIQVGGSGGFISNVSFRFLYQGINSPACNLIVNTIAGYNCHTLMQTKNDVKIRGVYAWNCMRALDIYGSIVSVEQVRGDSIGEHLVVFTGSCNNVYLGDLDADYCLKSIVHFQNPFDNYTSYYNIHINNIHGRYGVLKTYDSTNETFDFTNVTTLADIEQACMISVGTHAQVFGLKVSVSHRGSSTIPIDDSTSSLRCSSVIFGVAPAACARNLQLDIPLCVMEDGNTKKSYNTEFYQKYILKTLSTYTDSLTGNLRAFDTVRFQSYNQVMSFFKYTEEALS